jgi:hypothetical protein
MNNLSDQEIKELNQNLAKINKQLGNSWLSLSKGLLLGIGSVIGAALAVGLIGWFLNVIGVIPAFQDEAERWQRALEQSQNSQSIIPPSSATGVTE